MQRFSKPRLSAVLIVSVSASGALAQETRTWIDSAATNRLYADPANWSPTGIPGSLDTIVFANPSTSAFRFVNWNDAFNSTSTSRVEVRATGPIVFQNSGVLPSMHSTHSLLIERGSLYVEPMFMVSVTSSSATNIQDAGGLVVRDGGVFDAPLSRLDLGTDLVPTILSNVLSLQGTVNTRGSTLGVNAGSTAFAAAIDANARWNMSEDLTIGSFGEGELLVSGGGRVVNRDGLLGSESGGHGVANVTGAGSIWTNTRNLTVGRSGGASVANVTIDPGARLNVGDTAASATFPVAFSYVEDASANASDGGVLWVQGGGSLTNNNGGLSIGETAGRSGRVIVTNAGSTITDNDTFVGFSGAGSLEVSAGGTFNSDNLYLVTSGGAANVSVADVGSALAVSGNVFMGELSGGGTGTMTIGAGGRLVVGDVASTSTGISDAQSNASVLPGGILYVRTGNTLTNTSGSTQLGFTNGTTGRLQIEGPGAVVNDTSTIAGFSGHGILQISAGGQLNTGLAGAGVFGGSGSITVDSAGSQLWTSGDLLASGGVNGASTISTSNGGRILVGDRANVPGPLAASDMVVSDINAYVLGQGGRVSLFNGATLNHAGNIVVAVQANEFGSLRVADPGSRIEADGSVVVGLRGAAELAITNGGALEAANISLGRELGGVNFTRVQGPSSLLAANTNLFIGESGFSSMLVEGGGRIQSGQSTEIGRLPGPSAPAVIIRGTDPATGTPSTLAVGGMLFIGRNRTATLHIEEGGAVTAANLRAGQGASGLATINVYHADSSLVVQTELMLGGLDGSGVLKLYDGTVSTRLLTIEPGSWIDIMGGTFLATNIFTGATVPQIRDHIAAGYASGTWIDAGITSSVARNNPSLGIGFVRNDSVVTVKVALKGDTNLDGIVNFEDLLVLAANYNETGVFWPQGDSNYDAIVGFDDLLALAVNYNATFGTAQRDQLDRFGESFAADWALARSMVPVPASISVLGLGMTCLPRHRARRGTSHNGA